MFAAASISAASASVIQSAAAGIRLQSPSGDAAAAGFAAVPASAGDGAGEPSDFDSPPAGFAAASLFAAAFVFVADARSFFAQPLPLKWTDGAEIVLRIVPSAPHAGQKFGPG
jgi:hypothetical protein